MNDVKVILTEECVEQHNPLICDFTVCIPSAKKRKFTPRICTWKLRDPAVSKDFQDTFKDKVAALTPVESADDVEGVWSKLKTPLLEKPLRCVVSQRSINGKGKLCGGMTRLKKQSRRSDNVSRGT